MKQTHSFGSVAIWAAIIVLAFWLLSWWLTVKYLPGWSERGQFGDLFGSVNALFSGLAFAGLIIAILLQRNELSLQRTELKLQREEMQKSRAELAEQADLQRKELFATLTRLRITVLQAKIVAEEIASTEIASGFHGDQIKNIKKIADEMAELIVSLEQEIL